MFARVPKENRPARRGTGFWSSLLLILPASLALLVSASGEMPVAPYEERAGTRGQVLRIAANSAAGFHWPYLLVVPDLPGKPENPWPVLAVPNNTGRADDDFQLHLHDAEQDCRALAAYLNRDRIPFVLLMPAFPRFKERMGGWRCYTHALDRDTLLITEIKKPALTIRWQGERLDGDHAMSYDLNNLFAVQDNLLYRCEGASLNPRQNITGVSEFEITFVFENGFDLSRPFNFIEHPYSGGFLFRDARCLPDGRIEHPDCLHQTGIRLIRAFLAGDGDLPELWNGKGEKYLIHPAKPLERIDRQLAAMVADAREKLRRDFHQGVKEKILLTGFSAAGMFADRFCYLHPELVEAAAIGSPGGLPMVPAETWQGRPLRYPIGLADYTAVSGRAFDRDAFQRIRRLVYLGDQDRNDSVIYRDSFDPEDQQLVFQLLGDTPVGRFPIIEEIFRAKGFSNTRFVLQSGIGHEVTPAIKATVIRFLHDPND